MLIISGTSYILEKENLHVIEHECNHIAITEIVQRCNCNSEDNSIE